MPYATEAQRWGFAKEASRLTAETTPGDWIAVEPGSEMVHKLALLEDKGIRGIKAPYPSLAGSKSTEGKIKVPVRARNIGELLGMAFGAPTSAQQGGTAAYLHTFLVPSSIQPVTYTIFVDRSLNVLKYNGCAAKKISFIGASEDYARMEVDIVGLNEASGSIGSPTYTESDPLESYQTTFKIDTVTDTAVMDWKLDIDTMAKVKRTLNSSQLPLDVIQTGKWKVSGSFNVYFENVTSRDYFIANTTVAIKIELIGAVIASTYYNTLTIDLYKCHYKAFPYGDKDGLLAAAVEFEAVYATASSKMIQIALTNSKTSY